MSHKKHHNSENDFQSDKKNEMGNSDIQQSEHTSQHEGQSAPVDAPVTLSKKEYEGLLARIQELEGFKDQFLRKVADYDNAKRRLEKEKDDFYKFATEKLIRELLPVLDNLNRAIEQAEKANPNDAILKGIHLIEKHVFDVLKKYGLTRVESLDKPFSVEFHEAIGEVENGEKPEGTVVEEIESGYLLHGKVLRPARVRITKAPQGPVAEQSS